jgi:GNAT superfamily N-acetyltransferase
VRSVSAAAVGPLRQRVLRAGQPPETCVYPGDELASTLHLGIFDGAELVGIASWYQEPPPEGAQLRAVRLRGMATAPEVRDRGFGRGLLEAGLALAQLGGGPLLIWCNARSGAVAFYERFGFEREGEEFEIPDIGPHFLLKRRLGSLE